MNAADIDSDTLKPTEPHPAAREAIRYLMSLDDRDIAMWQSTFSSCALSGNRLAEVCSGTLSRLVHHKPVSDRYLLGLAWTMFMKPYSPEKKGTRKRGHKKTTRRV